MSKQIRLNEDINDRINKIINIFDNSATAIVNMLVDRGLRIFENELPKIAAQLESNAEIKQAFKEAIKQNYQSKRINKT